MKVWLTMILFIFSLAGCKTLDFGKITDITVTTVHAIGKASRAISDEEEYFLGRAVAARLLQYYPLYESARLTHYINMIGKTLSIHSEKPYIFGGYHFAILDTNEINAFACPGGIVLVTKGMIQLAQSEDELAAILAHELAHINHRDGVNSVKSARWTEALTIIGTTALKVYGKEEIARLVTIFEGSINDILKTLVVTGYSKNQEFLADEKAITYLTKAGYNPQALITVLERLRRFEVSQSAGFFKTHPNPEERIENLMNKLPTITIDQISFQKRNLRFSQYMSELRRLPIR